MSPPLVIVATTTIEVIGAVAGVVGVIVGILAFLAVLTLFLPRFDAAFDESHQAIRLKVKNRGRRAGRVDAVAVVDPAGDELSATFADLPDEKFHSGELAGRVTRKLIIRRSKEEGPFAPDARLYISWGAPRGKRPRNRYLEPKQPKRGTGSFYPDKSDWPPVS